MKFHCTYCGSGIQTANDSSGQVTACPNCQAEITVPPLREELREDLPPEFIPPLKAESKASKPAPAWGRELRRIFLYSLIACFAIGAATAITALRLFDLGETGTKIILTTVSLGAYSLTGLCCVVIAEKPQYRIFGGLGIAASVAGALFAILTNWEIVTGWEIIIRGRFSFLVVAISIAQASLLLMIDTKNSLVRVVRSVTLVCIAIVAMTILGTTLHANPESFAGYAWVIGSTVGVLAVLGTITTPLLHLATRETKSG